MHLDQTTRNRLIAQEMILQDLPLEDTEQKNAIFDILYGPDLTKEGVGFALSLAQEIKSMTCKEVMISEVCRGYMKINLPEEAYETALLKENGLDHLIPDIINTCLKVNTEASIRFAVKIEEKYHQQHLHKLALDFAKKPYIDEIEKEKEKEKELKEKKLTKQEKEYKQNLDRLLYLHREKKIAEGDKDALCEKNIEGFLSENKFSEALNEAKMIEDDTDRTEQMCTIFCQCLKAGGKIALEVAHECIKNMNEYRDQAYHQLSEAWIVEKNKEKAVEISELIEDTKWKLKLRNHIELFFMQLSKQ